MFGPANRRPLVEIDPRNGASSRLGPTHRRYLDVEDNMMYTPPTRSGYVTLILVGRDGGE